MGLRCALQEVYKYETNRCNGTLIAMLIVIVSLSIYHVPDITLSVLQGLYLLSPHHNTMFWNEFLF